MSIEGKILTAWGPNRIGKDPDVRGIVIEERDDERIVVQEEVHDLPTVVNPNGGWFLLTIGGAVIVGAVLASI